MVRLVALSLLAALASTALAEQQVLAETALFRGWEYSNCGTEDDPVKIKSIVLEPDPPKPGKDLTVTVVATTDMPIEEGAYADVTVKLGLIKLLSKQFDVCQEARSANASIQCPVQEGDYVVSHTVALPREIPKAKFNVKVQAYSADDEDMLCLDIKIDFMQLPW